MIHLRHLPHIFLPHGRRKITISIVDLHALVFEGRGSLRDAMHWLDAIIVISKGIPWVFGGCEKNSVR
jgi:hypothetical protein